MKYCIDCNKKISEVSIRCTSCSKKGNLNPAIVSKRNSFGKNNPSYKHGETLKEHFCLDCGKKLSYYQSKRCSPCSAKFRFSIKLSRYIDGRSLAISLCANCGKKLSEYRAKLCRRCETIRRLKLGIWVKPRNIPETKLENLLNDLFPKEYKYVGDNSVIIDCYNPDFINVNGQKKIVELFGDYWHNRIEVIKRDKRKLKVYKEYGYNTLIVWEKELKNITSLKNKIIEFHRRTVWQNK